MQDLVDIYRLLTAPRKSARRMSVKRLMKYYRHRVGRMPGTPYQVAAGFATGMAVSVTPFLGLHIVIGMALCLIMRISPLAMIIGSVLGGNPWTFPFIWVGSYKLGQWMLARQGDAAMVEGLHLSDLFDNPGDVLWPMLLGSLPLAALVWGVSYVVARLVVRRQASRRKSTRHKGVQ